MSGYANISAFPTENELLAPSYLAINQQQQANLNRLAPYQVQEAQQKIGATGIEYMARVAQSLLDPAAYPDEASRAAAYPGALAHLQSMGLAPNAPTQYPGAAALHQVAMMGTPSEKLAEFSANRAFGTALSPPQPGAAPPGGGGGGPGYAPTGTPLTPYIAPNLPQGVSTAEDQAVRTVIGEAADQPVIGQAAVAHVINNRMKQSGGSAQDVIFAPNQFEPWNNPATRAKLEAIQPTDPQYQRILNNVVRPVFAGQSQDPTGGATHFYSPNAQRSLGREPPAWATGTPTIIGGHNFYNIGYAAPPGGGGGTATAQAGGQPPAGPVILGDSLASPGGLGGSGVVGAKPQQVLEQVQTQAKAGGLQGKDVVISSGASNDPSATALAEQQIQAAKDGGAKSVTLVGVGTRPDIAGANPLLAQIAQRNGARFVPVDPATLSGDQVHPTNYAPLRQAVAGVQQPPAGGRYQVASNAPVPPPAATAPPAGAPAASTTTTDPETGLPVLTAPRNAILPAQPPPAPQQAQGQPQQPPPQASGGPPPPSLPPLNQNGLTPQQQQRVDALGQTGRASPIQQVQLEDTLRQQNVALAQKAYSDWIQAQQLAVSQGQLTVAQANSNLERLKADPNYQGAVKRAQELNSNFEARGIGAFMINPDGSRTLVPQPYQGEVIGSGGAKVPGFSYPGAPGSASTFSPTVLPGGQLATSSLSPEAAAESKAYGEQSEGIIKASAAAPVSLQRLDVLQNAADSFRPGSSAAMRLAGGKIAVDALQTLGITPPAWLANGAAAGETIGKEGGYLAAEMTRALGSHEAASVFSQVKNIQPNLEMSQGGFQAIINSVRQGLQRDQDIGTFREQWLADPKNNNSIRGMTDAFEKVVPIEAYASRVVPYPMPKSKDAAIPNVIYNTGQGPMLWNGTAFEALPTR